MRLRPNPGSHGRRRRVIINLQTQNRATRYHWMTQAVIPRPVAWILTENDDGGFNIAPFSYFNAVCSAPPLIGISIAHKPDGAPKDTLYNIRARGRLVVHIATAAQLAALNQSSANLDYGDSEIAQLNLKMETFGDMNKIADCPLAMLCCLHKEIALDDEHTQHLLLAEVQLLYAADSVLTTDAKDRPLIDAQKVAPIARLAAGNYARLGDIVSLQRPE